MDVGGSGFRSVRLDVRDASDGDVTLATSTSARLAVDDPVLNALSSLRKITVREVVAADDVVVVPGVGAGVENGLHGEYPKKCGVQVMLS